MCGMKKILSVAILIAVAMPAFAFAAQIRSGEQVNIGRNETIQGNYYIAGATLNIAGTITGDLLAGGGNLNISGPVYKDITVAGGTINLSGNVGEDLRVAGGDITISGSIGGDLVVAGGNVQILPDASIGGDLFAAGGKVVNQGKVKGKISIITSPEQKGQRDKGFLGLGIWWLIATLMKLVIGLVLYYLLRPGTQEVLKKAVSNFGSEFLRGFLILVAMPVALVLLMFTIVGIPISIMGFLIYAALMIVSSVFGAIILGGVVAKYGFKKPETLTIWIVLGGIILYQILKLIPFVGWIIVFVFSLTGLGVLAHTLYKQTIVKWRE